MSVAGRHILGEKGQSFPPKKIGEIGLVKKGALKINADLLACLLQGPQRVRKVLLGSDVPFRTGYGARVLPYNSQGGDAITTGMSFLVNLHLVDLHLVCLHHGSHRIPSETFAAWVKDGKVEPPNFKLSTIGSKIQDFITSAYVLAGSPVSWIVRIFLPDWKLKTIQKIMR